MNKPQVSVSEDKATHGRDLDIRPVTPHMPVPTSAFELTEVGEVAVPADPVREVSPRSKIRVTAILLALNVRRCIPRRLSQFILTAL